MRQFDVHATAQANAVLILRSDLVASIPVVPVALLQDVGERRTGLRGLEPVISSGDLRYRLTPYFVASLAPGELGAFLFNADGQRDEILRAFDILLTGV